MANVVLSHRVQLFTRRIHINGKPRYVAMARSGRKLTILVPRSFPSRADAIEAAHIQAQVNAA